MKTFQDFLLSEKWVADQKVRTGVSPIYENPSSKDLVDLFKSGLTNDLVRFAAIAKTKKLYVWSGMNMIHDVALNTLVSKKVISRVTHNNLEQAFCGECKLVSNRLTFAQNDGMDTYFGALIGAYNKKNFKNLDSWLPEPYYELKDLIDDLPDILDRYSWVSKFIDEYETKSSPAILKTLATR